MAFTPETSSWRWRQDNGSESSASWLADANTAIELPTTKTARLRLAVAETGGTGGNFTASLQTGKALVDQTWTAITHNFGVSIGLNAMKYENGTWAGCGSSGADGAVCYSTASDPSTGAWSHQIITAQPSLQDIAYGDGVWVICGISNYLATTTTLGGTWTTHTDPGFSGGVLPNIFRVGYFPEDNLWVACGNTTIATATDPTGTWTHYTPLGGVIVNRYFRSNGYWLTVRNQTYAYATTISGTWTSVTIAGLVGSISHIEYFDTLWVATSSSGEIAYASSVGGPWTIYRIFKSTLAVNQIVKTDDVYTVVGANNATTRNIEGGPWTRTTRAGAFIGTLTRVATNGIYYVASKATATPIFTTPVHDVVGMSATSRFFEAFDSANLTHGSSTTQQLGNGSFIASNSGVSETGTTGSLAYSANQEAEYEFTCKPASPKFSLAQVTSQFGSNSIFASAVDGNLIVLAGAAGVITRQILPATNSFSLSTSGSSQPLYAGHIGGPIGDNILVVGGSRNLTYSTISGLGSTWTAYAGPGSGAAFRCVTYSPEEDLWAISGETSGNFYTSNSVAGAWTTRSTLLGTLEPYVFIRGPDYWAMATGAGGFPRIVYNSVLGADWNNNVKAFNFSSDQCRTALYHDGLLALAGTNGRFVVTDVPLASTVSTDFTIVDVGFGTDPIMGMVHHNGLWIIVGGGANTAKIAYASDPYGTWTHVTPPQTVEPYNTVSVFGDKILVGGNNGRLDIGTVLNTKVGDKLYFHLSDAANSDTFSSYAPLTLSELLFQLPAPTNLQTVAAGGNRALVSWDWTA